MSHAVIQQDPHTVHHNANPFKSTILEKHTGTPSNKEKFRVLKFSHLEHTGPAGHIPAHCVALALMERFHTAAADAFDVSQTASYILSTAELIFPGFVDTLTQKNGITVEWLTVNGDPRCLLSDNFRPTDPVTKTKLTAGPLTTQLGVLEHHDRYGKSVSPEVAAGLFSIDMYTLGKTPSAKNISAFTASRPKAIQGKYHMDDIQKSFFTGKWAPTVTSLVKIDQVWAIYPQLRFQCGEEWIRWLTTSEHRSTRAFSMTFALTDGAGFASAYHIAVFLEAYPEAHLFPQIAPMVKEFRKMFEHFCTEDHKTRGFMKVLHGSNYALFKNSAQGALLAIAVTYAIRNNPTMTNFISLNNFQGVIAEFDSFCRSKNWPAVSGSAGVTVTKATV